MSPKLHGGIQGKVVDGPRLDRVLALLREGVYCTEVGRRCDVSEYAVRCIAHKHGITPVKAKRGPQPKEAIQLNVMQDDAQYWRGQAYNARWWRQLGDA
jgi:hypothetical protein